MSKLQKIGRFLECHSIGVFAVTMAMSVFLLFDPLGQRAWDTFFTNNEKVLEIYWQTLTLLLVILIPVTGAVIGKLDKKFPEFGARIFFQIVARVRQFWILIPFSFLLFFARVPVQNMPPEGISVNLEVLRIIHYLLFVLWCFLFWGFFEILRKSVALFVDLGDLQNEVFYRHLSEYSRQQKTMSDDENEGPAWKLLWDGIDVKNDKWHRKFLLLFWKRQEELIGNKQYLLATTLLESFSQRYLTFGDGQKQIDVARQMNARKRWLWFCEKQMNDKTENPYAIAIRLLDIHFSTWRNLEEIKNPGNGNNMDPKKRGRLSTLQRLVRSMLETLFRDELGKTDDYYDSFFRCLTGFFDTVAPDKSTLSPKKYQEYLESLPVYQPVFEAAYNSHLSNYEPHAEGSGFPNQWRVLEACLEQTNSIDSVQRRVWLEQFCTWSRDHIDHGKKEWDNALDGALKMLFPEAYAPWMAFAFAYRALAFGKSQIAGRCSWNRNFGYDSLLIDMSDMPEEGWEQKHDERMMKVTRERQTIAVTIIQKFRFFGKPGQITNLIAELESLSGTLSGDSESENNRREILEMLQEIAKSSP
jgi:hypothetical protein